MSKNLPSLLLAPLLGAATITTLSACGDEVTEVNETTQVTGMLVVKKGEALPECGAENEGTMAYSMDSAAAYYCIDEEWTSLQGKDGKDGKDGADGKDGKDGKDGEDGTDGTDGEDGKDGSDATGCKMTEDDFGYITMTCGKNSFVSKNLLCEGEEYNQDTHFCFKEQIYQKCNGSIFNPDSQFCRFNIIYPKCGGKVYEPETESCTQDTIYRHCTTDKEFDRETHFCQGEKISSKCGWKIFNEDSLFCSGENLFELCNGERYITSNYFCADNQILSLCDGMKYDPKTQYCSITSIHEINSVCGGVGYDSTDRFCDYRDSSLYRYVTRPGKSGDSVIWMAENLNLVTEKSLFGLSDSTSRKYLGRVYYADSLLVSLCPQGWHLPDSTEYATLLTRSMGECAHYLKGMWNSDWLHQEDRYLFSLYPTYSRKAISEDYGLSYFLQHTAALWTSSTRGDNPLLVVIGEKGVSSTVECIDFISSDDLIDGNFYITYANVRCVKDK